MNRHAETDLFAALILDTWQSSQLFYDVLSSGGVLEVAFAMPQNLGMEIDQTLNTCVLKVGNEIPLPFRNVAVSIWSTDPTDPSKMERQILTIPNTQYEVQPVPRIVFTPGFYWNPQQFLTTPVSSALNLSSRVINYEFAPVAVPTNISLAKPISTQTCNINSAQVQPTTVRPIVPSVYKISALQSAPVRLQPYPALQQLLNTGTAAGAGRIQAQRVSGNTGSMQAPAVPSTSFLRTNVASASASSLFGGTAAGPQLTPQEITNNEALLQRLMAQDAGQITRSDGRILWSLVPNSVPAINPIALTTQADIFQSTSLEYDPLRLLISLDQPLAWTTTNGLKNFQQSGITVARNLTEDLQRAVFSLYLGAVKV